MKANGQKPKGQRIMAINISRASKIITDTEGYVTAKLFSVVEKISLDPKGKEITQLEWVFKVPTTKKVADKYLWTGINVNSQRTYYPIDANGVVSPNPEYNRLTKLLLALGLLTEQELNSDDDIDLDIEELVGREFKFKVIPDREKPALGDIDIATMQLLDAASA